MAQRRLCRKDEIQIGEEMGESYQQHALDRLIVKTIEGLYQTWVKYHGRGVCPLVPAITYELLWGYFGGVHTPDPLEKESDQGGG